MILFTLLVPVVLLLTHLVLFPKTKGTLRPLKVPVKNR